ncbi:Flp family type IVb pilin [Alkalicella caledoniensis]|uniref:Flp family type IVb pilin n=1 Tax=Alkalicella caledoniensis TaxID=2731377 RepID=A0A7G9W7E0_ALKCA|nr:Flp family type IVb pilin [Alkalicella caledoniensis]QNO14602.1 Flp family type IVb pilin [Alkalicella caledoniensis]
MYNILRKKLLPKLKEKAGQGMVEYSLMIGLVALVVFGILSALGPTLALKIQEAVEAFNF